LQPRGYTSLPHPDFPTMNGRVGSASASTPDGS
jgi:hypothetical protein